MPREDAKANKKKIATRFRTSVGRGRDRTIATTHREAAPKRGQRRETACVPTCVDVGWRRRWRKTKQEATGEWNRPFSLRFPVFSRFRLLAVGMDATTTKGDMAFTIHTHRTAGMGAKRPKGERRGIFFIEKKKVWRRIWVETAHTFFVFEVGESVRGFLKRERRNFMNKESCKLVEAKLQTIYYTHTYTRALERICEQHQSVKREARYKRGERAGI